MDNLTLMLFCSIAPAILLIAFVRYRDRKNPEPWKKIFKGIFFGILSIIVTFVLHKIWLPIPYNMGFGWVYDIPLVRGVFTAFYEAAIPEETAKLIMLWFLLRKNVEFDENMDGIVYAVCIGMGFAGLENIMYVFGEEESWQTVAVTRSIFSVPGHYIFAVLMGFFYSIVHFQPNRYGKYKYLVWILPVLAHGVYDSICFLGSEHIILGLLSYIPLIWFCIKMHKFCFKRIHDMQLFDEDRKDIAKFTDAMRNME